MELRDGIEIDDERLADICRRHHVAELSVFGSVLRDDFGPDSDLDLLYVLTPGSAVGYFELADLERELSELANRDVDLVPKRFLHWYIRDEVVAEARVLYAA